MIAESAPLAAPASLTPRGTEAGGGSGDGTGCPAAASQRRAKGGGLSRAKAAHQKERLRVLSTPLVRHHVMKDLPKVRVRPFCALRSGGHWRFPELFQRLML